MSGVDAGGPLWIGFGTDAEEHFYDFFPVCSVGVSVQEPQVKLQMRPVVGGERRAIRRLIQKVFFGH
jgi:hypothetical protein